MKAPSFFIAAEDNNGMTMEYRSKRRGFQYYVQGQVKELSKNFAQEIKKLEIELKKQEVIFSNSLFCCVFFWEGAEYIIFTIFRGVNTISRKCKGGQIILFNFKGGHIARDKKVPKWF